MHRGSAPPSKNSVGQWLAFPLPLLVEERCSERRRASAGWENKTPCASHAAVSTFGTYLAETPKTDHDPLVVEGQWAEICWESY